ncbi:hypothetical protein DICA1_C04126 [Diutina catenulata]
MMLRSRTLVASARALHKSATHMKPDTASAAPREPLKSFFPAGTKSFGEKKGPSPTKQASKGGSQPNRFRDQMEKPYGKSRAQHRSSATHHTRRPRFEFTTGTEQQKEALKWIVGRVHELKTEYKVDFLEQGQIKRRDFVGIANSVDLKQNGVQLIVKDGFPLIKLVKPEEMLRTYSDHLAAVREQELLQQGNSKMLKIVQNRMKQERKKSAQKQVTMKWSISVSDLKAQKRNELVSRVEKGEPFIVELSSRRNQEAYDEEAWVIELKKRELVFDTLEGILTELPCSFEFDQGTLEGKLSLKVAPTQQPKQAKKVEEAPKKQKKVKSAKPVQKKQEEDLDAMYSFKLED